MGLGTILKRVHTAKQLGFSMSPAIRIISWTRRPRIDAADIIAGSLSMRSHGHETPLPFISCTSDHLVYKLLASDAQSHLENHEASCCRNL